MPNDYKIDISNNKKVVSSTSNTTESLVAEGKKQRQIQQKVVEQQDYLHKGKILTAKIILKEKN